MKTILFLIALGLTQVLGLMPEVDPTDEVRAPQRRDPNSLAGCSGNDEIKNCDKCYNPDLQCNECSDRYYRKPDWLTCLACPSKCLECTDTNADDVTECTKCEPKYYKTDDKKCDRCVGHCLTCKEADECSTCDPSYHLMDIANGEQRRCLDCRLNCLECEDSGDASCLLCEDGYYLTTAAPSSCSSCALGCALCKDGQSCDLCETGKTWDAATKTCKACIANCEICDTNAACTKCDTGYSLANDKSVCYDCSNCVSCPAGGGCTACNYGYILQDSLCYACPLIDSGAAICDDCGNAAQTRPRYYDTATSDCLYCVVNAASCTDATTYTCAAGYFDDGTGCSLCDASCKTCTGTATTCASCEVGEYLNVAVCASCATAMTNCAACDDATTCTACVANFYLNPNDATNCIGCPADADHSQANCEQCGSTATLGKQMSDVQCTAGGCPTGCLVCTAANTCDLCSMGTAWDGTANECSGTGGVTDGYENDQGNLVKCEMGKEFDTGTGACDTTSSPDAQAVYDGSDNGNILYCIQATATGNPITSCSAQDTSLVATGRYTAAGLSGCEEGTTLNAAGDDCEACSAAPYVWNKATCSHCTEGLWEGTCIDCLSGCATCATAVATYTCSACAAGKYQNGQACEDVNCNSVDHQNECIACATTTRGTNWQSNVCYTCPENCIACTTDQDCTTCVDGMSWDSGKKKCVNCDWDDTTECSTCGATTYGRYYDSSLTKCINCPTGCKYCSKQTSVECSECHSGYYFDATAKSCTICGTPTDSSQCDQCRGDSYYWDDTASSCNACPTFCTKCSGANTCTTCNAGYYWDSTDTTKCQLCPSNCAACSAAASCTTCNVNRYFDGTSCVSCPLNCADCQTNGGCVACNVGYYLKDDGLCYACSSAMTHCERCSSETSCQECGDGRYFKADTKTCEDCLDNCKECPGTTTCTECKSGYCWDEGRTKCHSTSGTNCVTCGLNSDDEVTCDTCGTRDHLEICTACTKSNCIECKDKANECGKCRDGYYLDDVSCTVCPSGLLCASCSGPDECKKCITGYFWDTTALACTSCPSGCSTCTNTESCKCDRDNWFFDKEKKRCSACMSGCESCSDPGDKCTKCYSNYTPVTAEGSDTITACTACPIGCGRCRQETAETLVCEVCMEGYYMIEDANGGTCQLCSTDFTDCISCKDDKEKDGVIRTGECSACAGGVLKDDESECLRCSDINGCDECVDLPSLCMQCADTYHPTLDLQSCNMGCYHCDSSESESCVDNVAPNNTIIESCPGLGETASCYSKMTKLADGNVITRYCNKNSTCPEPNSESCQQGNTDEECVVCCKDNTCNTVVLQGQTASGTISHHTAGFMISALMMLLCHVILNV